MSEISSKKVSIQKVTESRLPNIEFDNLAFGSTFADHMFECDYINGEWKNPTIKPYGNISISPGAKVFHYGQAVFEGMKAYKDEAGDVFLFRPDENYRRINKSSKRLAIPEFPEDFFFEGLHTLINMERGWVQPGIGNSLYIRPFVIATQVGVSASPSDRYKFMILLSPVRAYYTGDVRVVIAQEYSRSADGGVGAAKAAGNYGAQFYPTNLAKEKGFQQVIWTDSNEHKYLEEAGTMNVFFRINDTLVTAPTSDRILDGVTRKSVLKLAERAGIHTEVRRLTVAELVEAAQQGELKEIFGSGTAAVISPVSAFSYDNTVYDLEKPADSYATRFKEELMNIQYNLAEDTFGWRVRVER